MDSWNNFVQSKMMRVLFNGICAVCCAFYGFGAAMDLVSPSDSAVLLMETTGSTAFYVLTVARLLVCVWVAVVFVRMTVKILKEEDK